MATEYMYRIYSLHNSVYVEVVSALQIVVQIVSKGVLDNLKTQRSDTHTHVLIFF